MTTESAAHRRVLIVEDESMVAMLLEDMLADLGHDVVATVGRLDRATQAVSNADVDFAILDVNLNGEYSYSLASGLDARGIPYVFVTGYGSAGVAQEWKDTPVLQKPFQARDLERVMLQALSPGAVVDPPRDDT